MDLERGRGSHDDVAQPLRHLELLRRQRTAAGHDLGLSLRVELLTLGIREAYGIERLARARRVLIARAEGVHQLVRDDDVVAAGHGRQRERVHYADQALLQAVRVRHRIERRWIVIEHEDADARWRASRHLRGVGREPAELQAPPRDPEGSRSGRERRRQLRALRVELHVHRLLDAHPVAVGLMREERLDAGEVLHRESVDVTLRARRAVAIERVEAYPERFLPALRRDAVEPGVDRDAGEHQQQEEDADVLPHGAVSSWRQCPRGKGTGLKAAGAWPTRVPARTIRPAAA